MFEYAFERKHAEAWQIHRRQGVFLQYKPLNCTCKLYSLRIHRSLIYRCLGREDNPKSKRRMGCLCTTPLKVVHRHCLLFAWWNFYWVLRLWVRSLKVSESFEERNCWIHQWLKKNQAEHTLTSWKSFVEWEQLFCNWFIQVVVQFKQLIPSRQKTFRSLMPYDGPPNFNLTSCITLLPWDHAAGLMWGEKLLRVKNPFGCWLWFVIWWVANLYHITL